MPAALERTVQVIDASLELVGNTQEVRWQVQVLDHEPVPLFFRFPATIGLDPDNLGDTLAAALLLVAMSKHASLQLPAPLSPKLHAALDRIQDIYRSWDHTLSRIEVRAPLRKEVETGSGGTGLFFSGGVDSLYSLLSNQDQDQDITHLLVIHGFDILLGEKKQEVFDRMLSNARRMAEATDKQVVAVQTNIKTMMATFGVPWGQLGHGAALASIAHALRGCLGTALVSATTTYDNLYPTGSHPHLDPLWSSEAVAIVHQGCETSRIDKLRYLRDHDLAMQILRVCWQRVSGEFNCGSCSKCLRTMVALHIAGALRRCQTLPDDIDLEALRSIPFANVEEIGFAKSLASALATTPEDRAMRDALLAGVAWAETYFARVEHARQTIDQRIPLQAAFILFDEDTIREKLGAGRRVLPFIERQGRYAGRPPRGHAAVEELERLLRAGARFFVVWWATRHLLDSYPELHARLRQYPVIHDDETLQIFDLA